jgi:replication-associated recombination protein RarA
VREHGAAPVPSWLRSGPRPGSDRGGYENPHSLPGHLGAQELAPAALQGERFYTPDDAEAELAARLEEIRAARERQAR